MPTILLPILPVLFQDIVWTLDVPQQKTRSEFTRRTKIIGTPGAEQWTARVICLPPVNETEERAWHVFFASLRGQENTTWLPALPRRQSSASAPNVTAVVAGNRALVVSSSASLALGMWATVLQANGVWRLVKIIAIAGTTISFEPALTANPATGVALVIGDPFSTVRLADARAPLPTIGRPFEFNVEEAL